MTRHIRRAGPEEAPALRDLAHRSKAYWPYSEAFLEAVRPLLELDARDVDAAEVWVLEVDGRPVGWHRVTLHADRAELEDDVVVQAHLDDRADREPGVHRLTDPERLGRDRGTPPGLFRDVARLEA